MDLKINHNLEHVVAPKEPAEAWQGQGDRSPVEQEVGLIRTIEGKAIPVQRVPKGDDQAPGRLAVATKKISRALSKFWHFPVTQRVAKGLAKAAVDLAEGYVIEKARGQIGEAILPGGVPAMELALLAITGTTKALNDSIQK